MRLLATLRGWCCTDPHMRAGGKSRVGHMVDNGEVEPASPDPITEPATSLPTPVSAASAAPAEPQQMGVPAVPGQMGVPAVPGQTGVLGEGSGAVEAGSDRQGRSLKDMVLSLAVLVIPIALLLIFYRVVLSGDAPVTVDPASTIQEAQGIFSVAVPGGLGSDWHVTAATLRRESAGATLRLGYVDPDKDPIQLVESTVSATSLLPAELGPTAKPLENFRTATGVWRRYDARPGEQALVLTEQNRTIIVVGKADAKNLEHLANSLS